jgi:uncharacterized membrane protein YoaT (DUF817 family)
MWYFTCNWHNIFTVHVPNLITVEFLVCSKSYVTTNAQNVLQLVAKCQRPRASCKWFDRHQERLGEVSLHFEFGLNAVGALSVRTDKNIKARGQHYFGLYLKNCLHMCIDLNFFLFRYEELISEIFPSVVAKTCIASNKRWLVNGELEKKWMKVVLA